MSHWTIAAEPDHEAKVVMSAKQLTGLVDKLLFRNEIYRADLHEALESLLCWRQSGTTTFNRS